MSKSTSEFDALYAEVQRRMIENGEWDRLLHLLSSKLSESGWTDELLHCAKDNSRTVNPLTLRAILQQLLSHAQSANFHSLVCQYADFFHHSPAAVPPPVKREITTLIKQFVKEQFDK